MVDKFVFTGFFGCNGDESESGWLKQRRRGREGGRFDRALRLLEEGRREGGNADTEPGGKVAL